MKKEIINYENNIGMINTFEDKPHPVIYTKQNRYYSFDNLLNVIDITDERQKFFEENEIVTTDISFLMDDDQICKAIYDLSFLRFIAKTTNKEDAFNNELEIIDKIQSELSDKESLDIKQIREYLLAIFKVCYNENIWSIFNHYKEYYKTVVIKLLQNIAYFNEQRFYINALKFKRKSFYDSSLVKFENRNSYIPVSIQAYNWSQTGRINSNLYSLIPQLEKDCLKPFNDCLLQIDCRAAEFNFLLSVCKEDTKFNLEKKTYWTQLKQILGLPNLDDSLFKNVLYMKLYGAGEDTLIKEGIIKQEYHILNNSFKKEFPETYAFCFFQKENPYLSKESSIIYDYFNKEIYVDNNYKKLNYWLQSSLSTKFQLFVFDIIELFKQNQLKSKIIMTIHDSIYIDMDMSEKDIIFSFLKKKNTDPKLLLTIKNTIKKINE